MFFSYSGHKISQHPAYLEFYCRKIAKTGNFIHVLGTCKELICRDKHANTNFSYMFSSRENFLGKRGARDTFFHHEDTVDVDTSFQQCETRQRYQTRKQVRGAGGGGRTRCQRVDQVYRNVGHKQYTCFKSILFFLII